MNLPNKLTILRIILVPVYAVAYYLELSYAGIIAAVIFVIASLTDMLDGKIARKQGIVTDFGKLMDPIADKLLVGTAVILLVGSGRVHPLVAVVLIGREFVIAGYRLIAASKGVVVAADIWGKIKTVVQIIGVTVLTLNMSLNINVLQIIGDVLMYASVALSIISCTNYIVKNKSVIKFK